MRIMVIFAIQLFMIGFDEKGNMQPYQLVSMDMDELYTYFVRPFPQSIRREELFLYFQEYQRDLFRTFKKVSEQWIDGSFVSTKLEPGDIDLVNIIPEKEFDMTPNAISFFTIGGSDQTYGVDAHLIVEYEDTEQTRMRKNYFLKWFGHDRHGNPKGIVDLKRSN